MATDTNSVTFRVLVCKHCKHIYKWIDERMPTFCPECGQVAFHNTTQHVVDVTAMLTLNVKPTKSLRSYDKIVAAIRMYHAVRRVVITEDFWRQLLHEMEPGDNVEFIQKLSICNFPVTIVEGFILE